MSVFVLIPFSKINHRSNQVIEDDDEMNDFVDFESYGAGVEFS